MAERTGRLELSVSLPTWADAPARPAGWAEMRDLAQQAEAIGINAIFVADETGFDRAGAPTTEFWDGWTLLPALAEVTRRVAIGPLVAVATLRHPIGLARMAAALDEVSGGRLILGLGSGNPTNQRAWRMLGTDTTRLYTRFAESLEVLVRLLRQGEVDFAGEHFAAHQARLGPGGPRSGAIPIWIAATGPKMLRLAARWADAVNFGPPLATPEAAAAMVRQFEGLCHEAGRDPASVSKTGWALVAPGVPATESPGPRDSQVPVLRGDAEHLAARFAALHAAGIEHISCYLYPDDAPATSSAFPATTARGLEWFAQVITTLRRMEAKGPTA